MNEELLQLENKVRELEIWKASRVRQRLTFPIDVNTRDIVNRKNIIATGNTYPRASLGISDLLNVGLICKISGTNRVASSKVIVASSRLFRFDANPTTDVIDYLAGSFAVVNGDAIGLNTTSILPSGLSDGIIYYVINATANTFKVSLTQGGVAVDITSVGTGDHYFGKVIL